MQNRAWQYLQTMDKQHFKSYSNVIDSRYRSKKSLIVTTNLTLDELKHPSDLGRARIYDRVLERCVPLKINNQNIRELNAAANMQEARKLFNPGT